MPLPRLRASTLFTLMLGFALGACSPLIGPYSLESYKYATSLKVETLAMMDKATEEYATQKENVETLELELKKAHEYVKGLPVNTLSARQWEILINPNGDLAGKFFRRWQERGTMSPVLISEFKSIVSDAFDEIICLEVKKQSASKCLSNQGE